jgi:excisionase family DNA binding protein
MSSMISLDLITTKEAAAIVGVTEGRIRQLHREGTLPAQKVDGRTWLYPRSEAEKLAERKSGPGRPRSGQKNS